MPAQKEYIDIEELEKWGGAAGALHGLSVEEKQFGIRAASGELDTMTGSRYATSFTAVSDDIKVHVARAAMFHNLSQRGFSAIGDDSMIERNYDRALSYFRKIGRGKLNPNTTNTDPAPADVPTIEAETDRGWGTDRV